jgi:hypothetical protein
MAGHPLAILTSRSRSDQPRAVSSCARHAGNLANRYHGLGEVESAASPLRCPFRLEGHQEANSLASGHPMVIEGAKARRPELPTGDRKGIIHLDPKIPDGAFDLRVAKQELYSS